MISSLKCVDLTEQYFDEIDENEKNSTFTRNEECNHFEISIKRISENFKFKKYFLTIECKICNTPLKMSLTKNKDSISYYCKKCNKPQFCINFSYENTMCIDEESYDLKDENKNNIEDSYSNKSTEYNSQIQDKPKTKVFSTPPSQIQDEPKIKVYSTPEDQTQIKKSEKVKIKEYYTPVPVTKKIYKTPEQKEFVIKYCRI